MGGEGGGVLADWIVDLAEHAGYIAQTTSVPGVAQRTGATIYYLELFRRAAGRAPGAAPVLALMPTPGDVDIVLASELMEAGRAVQRGLVTTDRTTLIASTHRVYSMAEKTAMGDGRVDAQRLIDAGCAAAQRFVHVDIARLAERQRQRDQRGAVRRAGRQRRAALRARAFEAAIRRGGVGVDTSLAAFDAGFAVGCGPQAITPPLADAGHDGVQRSSSRPAPAIAGATHRRGVFRPRSRRRWSPASCAWPTTRTRPTPRSTSTG